MSTDELLGWVEKAQLNLIHCVPSLFRAMVSADLQRWSLRSLRHILMAGETLQVADVKKWMAVYGDKVKLVITFRGREVDHSDLGIKILDNVVRDVAAVGTVEHRDESEIKIKSMIITPKQKGRT